MTDLDTALAANRSALGDLLATAEQAGANWTTPLAPGKWSPSQLVEHVARALEESANSVAGEPSKFPSFPPIMRFVARTLFFNRVLRRGAFFNAKAAAAFDPEKGPASPAEARRRLVMALDRFDQACRSRTLTAPEFTSTIFGHVSVLHYARFQELHTRHHCAQLSRRGGNRPEA